MNYGLSGFGVGIFCAPAVCPIEVVKVRMQLDRKASSSVLPGIYFIFLCLQLFFICLFYFYSFFFGLFHAIYGLFLGSVNNAENTPRRYSGSWDCFKKVVRSEGVLGLYPKYL